MKYWIDGTLRWIQTVVTAICSCDGVPMLWIPEYIRFLETKKSQTGILLSLLNQKAINTYMHWEFRFLPPNVAWYLLQNGTRCSWQNPMISILIGRNNGRSRISGRWISKIALQLNSVMAETSSRSYSENASGEIVSIKGRTALLFRGRNVRSGGICKSGFLEAWMECGLSEAENFLNLFAFTNMSAANEETYNINSPWVCQQKVWNQSFGETLKNIIDDKKRKSSIEADQIAVGSSVYPFIYEIKETTRIPVIWMSFSSRRMRWNTRFILIYFTPKVKHLFYHSKIFQKAILKNVESASFLCCSQGKRFGSAHTVRVVYWIKENKLRSRIATLPKLNWNIFRYSWQKLR